MYGGESDFNHKKDMGPLAKLVFEMRLEMEQKVQQVNFINQTTKNNKEMQRKGKVILANYVLGSGETSNPYISVPAISQRGARLNNFTNLEKVKEPDEYNYKNNEDDEDSSSDYKDDDDDKEKESTMQGGFTRDLDAAGNRVIRFSNGNIAFNPKNKTQNGNDIIIF